MKAGRLLSLGFACVLLAMVSAAAGVTPLRSAALRDFVAGPCAPGMAYDPACDVDHNGAVDIYDLQHTAGHRRHTGTYDIYLPALQKGAYRFPAMVPKTGQTTCYDSIGTVTPCPSTGQDGALQKGVSWPTPRFTDNGNGNVTDNLTGLIWLKNASCFGERIWATALTDANTLNSGECGLTDGSMEGDWRLPNVREMQSLVDYGECYPALPSGHPFTGVQSYYFWTSTTNADFARNAWFVDLRGGSLGGAHKTFSTVYVWPVRGG